MKLALTLFTISILLLVRAAMASNVAIVDSGTYFDHDLIKPHTYFNGPEISGNKVDDDRNGKVDDVNGWNFADNYGRVFFPEHIQKINPIVYKILTILAKVELGTATLEEQEFFKNKVKGLPDDRKKALLNHLNYYGQYAHGTHVSGIVGMGNEKAKIMSARIFPDSPPDEFVSAFDLTGLFSFKRAMAGIRASNAFYWFMASNSNKIFGKMAPYLASQKMDIANMSIGISLPNIAKNYLALRGKQNPTEDLLELETKKVFSAFESEGKKWLASAPETLFVVAAGNDAANNDKLPSFPANMNETNSITVAATKDYHELAKFSNYGATSVHVAAPGVAIMSSVPGPRTDQMLPMSGTSMAAPFVTMVASNIKDFNGRLLPAQIKEILIGTVDHKDWLKGKVISAGVVNPLRAMKAAQLSNSMAVAEAIQNARSEVRDMADRSAKTMLGVPADPEMLEWSQKLVF